MNEENQVKTLVCMNCGDIVNGDKCAFCEEHNIPYEVNAINMTDPIEKNLLRIISNEERLMLTNMKGVTR